MTTAKTLFQRRHPGEPSLADWWVPICHDPRFEAVLTFARAHLMEEQLTEAELKGANRALNALSSLSENEPDGSGDLPSPGLIHKMIEPKRITEPPKTTA